MTYRKIGGLHFFRVGRFHFITSVSKGAKTMGTLERIMMAIDGMSITDKWFVFSLVVWAGFVVAAYVLP